MIVPHASKNSRKDHISFSLYFSLLPFQVRFRKLIKKKEKSTSQNQQQQQPSPSASEAPQTVEIDSDSDSDDVRGQTSPAPWTTTQGGMNDVDLMPPPPPTPVDWSTPFFGGGQQPLHQRFPRGHHVTSVAGDYRIPPLPEFARNHPDEVRSDMSVDSFNSMGSSDDKSERNDALMAEAEMRIHQEVEGFRIKQEEPPSRDNETPKDPPPINEEVECLADFADTLTNSNDKIKVELERFVVQELKSCHSSSGRSSSSGCGSSVSGDHPPSAAATAAPDVVASTSNGKVCISFCSAVKPEIFFRACDRDEEKREPGCQLASVGSLEERRRRGPGFRRAMMRFLDRVKRGWVAAHKRLAEAMEGSDFIRGFVDFQLGKYTLTKESAKVGSCIFDTGAIKAYFLLASFLFDSYHMYPSIILRAKNSEEQLLSFVSLSSCDPSRNHPSLF